METATGRIASACKRHAHRLLLSGAVLIPLLCLLVEVWNGTTASDSSVFRYLGWRMTLGGGRCYIDAWDNKGPSLSLFNAIGWVLFPKSETGPSIVFSALWIAAAAFTYNFMKPYGRTAAAASACFLTLSGLGVCGGQFLNCQEVVALAFAAGGSCLLFSGERRWKYFLFGAAAGFPFMAKANLTGFWFAAGALWAYDCATTRGFRLFARRVLLSFAGFSLTLAMFTAAYFPDGIRPMWDAALFYNLFERINSGQSWAGWYADFFSRWSIFQSGGWFLPLFGLILATSAVSLHAVRRTLPRRMSVYLASWLAIETVLAFSAKSFYNHYLTVALLPASLILTRTFAQRRPDRASLLPMSAIALSVLLFSCCFVSGFRFSIKKNACARELYSWAADNMRGNGPVVTIGGPDVSEFLCRAGKISRLRYFAPCFYLPYACKERKAEILGGLAAALLDPCNEWLVIERRELGGKWMEGEIKDAIESRYKLDREFPALLFYKRTPSGGGRSSRLRVACVLPGAPGCATLPML